jgi:hypothetical protein
VHVSWNVHEVGSFVHGLLNVVGDLVAILIHGADTLELVLWGQADITETEDVLVNDEVSWSVVGSNWVLVGHTAFSINPDLSGFFVNALSHWALHEFRWAEIFESSAVKDVVISHFVVITETSASMDLNVH